MISNTIVFITHSLDRFGGADLSLLNLLRVLDKQTFHPVVVTRGIVASDAYRAEHIDSYVVPFKLNIASNNKFINIFARPFRWVIDEIWNYYYVCTLGLKLSKKYKVRIVHSNSSVFTFGYSLANHIGAKHVWHIREFQDLDFHMHPFTGWNDLHKKMEKSDCVISITNAICKHWQMDGHDNSIVLYNPVRSEKDLCFLPEKKKYLLFCSSNLNCDKGADVAVSIFCKSEIFRKGYRLKLIGNIEPAFKEILFGISDSYHQTDFIDYEGIKSDNEIKDYMANASVFLMCSKFEAMGRVTVEAMFYGCPVLGHNTGGTKELISDGVNGYLYNDVDEGIEKLKFILQDCADISPMIKRAQLIAKTYFSLENYKGSIMDIYNKMLNKSSL